ncbi:hypothetical protein PAXINDRAFT_103975 [Paxillus involutus ATCC 200175]|uniref:XPG-I domain-containing protein n=1 Tax=Paxillus involutus ATCC 200175 TaxID=664439 RepID=A0A0C9T9H5_PAXIN|nr:hypothetical protein PAXINDRAFT_103975 [Paxillus involutus ATCC 200175]
MGIEGLWEVLAPASERTSLAALAVRNRFEHSPPVAPYTVGVDVSVWFEQCQQPKWQRAHAQSGMNAPLRTFFFRLAHLSQHPIQLLFCYDGAERPAVKRGKRVFARDHWMVKPTRRILDAFNVPWREAWGEAEAELASMNVHHIVDAVLTDDSDVFAFGTHTVLRNSSLTPQGEINIYETSNVHRRVAPELTTDGFVLMAILCGGNYDEKGLPGCGKATALGMVRCGLAPALCAAAREVESSQDALKAWWESARHHLIDDPTGHLGCHHPKLAHNMPNPFPTPGVTTHYLRPALTPPNTLAAVPDPRSPNVTSLAELAQQLFGWDDAPTLLATFRRHVWGAVVVHDMLRDLKMTTTASPTVSQPPATNRSLSKHAVHGVECVNVPVPTDALSLDTLAAHKSVSKGHENATSHSGDFSVQVPQLVYTAWIQLGGRTRSLSLSSLSPRPCVKVGVCLPPSALPSPGSLF